MSKSRSLRSMLGLGIALTFVWWAASAQGQAAPVKMEWFSWSIFRLTSPAGKVVLTNPFVKNPDSPVKIEDFPKVDVILVADGHGDEVGSADEIAIKTGAKIITPHEFARGYFQPRKVPADQILRSQVGDWSRFDGLAIRTVNAVHGSGGGTGDSVIYGGPALGFMIRFENGLTVYFAGSTDLTMDMQLWGTLFKPDVAILPLSANRDPQDIVHMVRFLRTENPNLKTIIPHHHRLKPPPGAPTPADMENVLKASGLPVKVINPELGKTYELTK